MEKTEWRKRNEENGIEKTEWRKRSGGQKGKWSSK